MSVRSVYRTARSRRRATAAAADPTVSLSFRAPASEVDAFEKVARGAGLGRRGSAFRSVLRMAVGLVEVPGGDLGRLHEATVRVSRIGVNLNQLTRSVNRGKLRLGEGDRVLLRELAREVEALRREWGAVHEAAARRRCYAERVMACEAAGQGGDGAPGTPGNGGPADG